MRWWLLLLVIAMGIGFGWWWSRHELQWRSTEVTSVVDPATGVVLISDTVVRDYIALVPAPQKPQKVTLQLHGRMPESLEVMYTFTKGTAAGGEGKGIGCGYPHYSPDMQEVTVDVYMTTAKLVAEQGREKALFELNRIVRKCLAWAVWGISVSQDDYSQIMGTAGNVPKELSLVEFSL